MKKKMRNLFALFNKRQKSQKASFYST